MTYQVSINGQTHNVELRKEEAGHWTCRIAPESPPSEAQEITVSAQFPERDVLSLLIGARSYEVRREQTVAGQSVTIGALRYDVEVRDPRSLNSRRSRAAGSEGPKKITAPMPGKVVRVLAPEGAEVEAGQGVIVIEAMKMQNELKSPKKGVVTKIAAAEGAPVNAGDALAIVE